jgi:ADP-ribose pyrophosphatase
MSDATFHYRGKYLGIAERNGWEYASRTNVSQVAVLVAVTDERELVLVEQYRIPVSRRVIELPAGLVGDHEDPDESVVVAARRELLEETGYTAARVTELFACPSTAGMSDEIITFLLAEGLEKAGPGGGDDSEDITVHVVPLADACDWLAGRRREGLYLDPKVYSGILWLERQARGEEPCP